MNNDRNALIELLGTEKIKFENCEVVNKYNNSRYIVEELVLNHEISAILVRPTTKKKRYKPILYCHANPSDKSIGKNELIIGIDELQNPPYANVLTDLGFIVLCIDNIGFGERSNRSLESYFREFLWKGKNVFGKFVSDNLIAIDYLLSLKTVVSEELTVIGFSMGSSLAYFLAAVDERVKYCIEMCGMTDFERIEKTQSYETRSCYFYIFNLLNKFTLSQINELIAPRYHMCLAGVKDSRTPKCDLDTVNYNLTEYYEKMGVPENWTMVQFDCGHKENKEMREIVTQYFKSKGD